MVRSIVGTLLQFEKENRTKEDLKNLIDLKKRIDVGQTAPARGLFLEKVYYSV